MFRSAGNLASLLFPSSSPSSSSKRSTPRRRGSANEPPSDSPSASGPGNVGEFGESLSASASSSTSGSRRHLAGAGAALDSQPSQALANGLRTAPLSPGPAPSSRTFVGGGTASPGRRRSSDRTSQASTAGPSAPTSLRGSPMPSRKHSAALARSPSALGELDLGPQLTIDELSVDFAASVTTGATTGPQSKVGDALSHSASAPLSEPLSPPPSLSRHGRSDSAPTIKGLSRPASPIRVVYYASDQAPADAGQRPKLAAVAVDALEGGKALNGQALEGIHGWQQDVWVTLRSEGSQNEFYANPRTGDCSWEPPTGALVLPIPSEGIWYELCDLTQDGACYYFHTLSKTTQWTRPTAGLIVPLSMIQLRNLGFFQPRATRAAPPAAESRSPTREQPRRRTISALAPASHHPVRPALEGTKKHSAPPVSFAAVQTTNSGKSSSNISPSISAAGSRRASLASGSALRSVDARSSQPPPPMPPTPPQMRTPTKAGARRGSSGSPAPSSPATDKPKLGRLATQLSSRWGSSKDIMASPLTLASATSPTPSTPMSLPAAHPVPGTALQSKRLSTGEHYVLPSDLSSAIQRFAVPDFSDRYLSGKHTEGGFRKRKIPMERVMRWQKNGINEPLLVLDAALKPLATKAFRIVQRTMGDRSRPVDVPSLSASTSARSSFMMLKASRPTLTERERVLTEVRWLLWVGITHVALRDEIWSGTLKQLSFNPSLASVIRGWELLCLLSTTFAPTAHFEAYVHGFIRAGESSTVEDEEAATKIAVMASYCLLKLKANKPARGKAPTILEIETGLGAAFYPSTFGSTLEETMARQAALYPTEKVPIILPFLAQGILALGGAETEGLFRIPGDSDQVAMVKDRIDRGRYELDGIEDVHVCGSLLKLWLRELQEPLIPGDRYAIALTVSASAPAVCGFARSLPLINRLVLGFVVSFLQRLVRSEAATLMSLQNLALVFAPSIFRCPDDELNVPNETNVPTPFVNAAYERAFMVHLLQAIEPATDLGYAPFADPPACTALPAFDTSSSPATSLSTLPPSAPSISSTPAA